MTTQAAWTDALPTAMVSTIIVVAIVGLVAVAALWLLRRASIRWHLVILGGGVTVSVAASVVAAAELMLISRHDFILVLSVTAVSSIGAIGLAWILGGRIAGEARRLSLLAALLADAYAIARRPSAMSRELGEVADALVHANERLRIAREGEERLDRARREFLSWLSHDLRTPVAGMRAVIDTLADDLVDDPAPYLDTLRAQGDRLGLLIDDVFQLSLIDAGRLHLTPQAVDLGDLVSDVLVDLGPAAFERVVMNGTDGAVTALVDPTAVSRAVRNVVSNALQYAPSGPIVVEIDRVHDERRHAEIARIVVTDTGPGLQREDHDRAFDAGWRGNAHRGASGAPQASGGAGLGLAIVRGLAEAHGGTVGMTTGDDTGCRVTITLPRRGAAG